MATLTPRRTCCKSKDPQQGEKLVISRMATKHGKDVLRGNIICSKPEVIAASVGEIDGDGFVDCASESAAGHIIMYFCGFIIILLFAGGDHVISHVGLSWPACTY